jgi:hypothetical protein
VAPLFSHLVNALETGSVGLVYEETREGGYNIKFSMVGWKGKNSLRAYVPKNERVHYLRLIGGDTSKYEKNKFLKNSIAHQNSKKIRKFGKIKKTKNQKNSRIQKKSGFRRVLRTHLCSYEP